MTQRKPSPLDLLSGVCDYLGHEGSKDKLRGVLEELEDTVALKTEYIEAIEERNEELREEIETTKRTTAGHYLTWQCTEAGLREEITVLEADNKRLLEALQWNPIDTAPKDRIILLGLPVIGNIRSEDRRVYEGRWDVYKNTWTSVNGFILLSVASHWLDLPCYPLTDSLAQTNGGE